MLLLPRQPGTQPLVTRMDALLTTWSSTPSGSAGLRTTAGFYDTDSAAPVKATTRRVASHSEVDVQAGYIGIKSLQLTLGIKNLFDRMPPFSLVNASSNGYSQMGFAELYTNRGRFFYGTVAYKFK